MHVNEQESQDTQSGVAVIEHEEHENVGEDQDDDDNSHDNSMSIINQARQSI